ncbi:MAG: hypothetical protein WAM14_07335 [Candidatus Nitrosopolaris sp.]
MPRDFHHEVFSLPGVQISPKSFAEGSFPISDEIPVHFSESSIPYTVIVNNPPPIPPDADFSVRTIGLPKDNHCKSSIGLDGKRVEITGIVHPSEEIFPQDNLCIIEGCE